MIRYTPSKVAVLGIATWWTAISLTPGDTFGTSNFEALMAVCRHEWVVSCITATLVVLLGLDLANRLPAPLRDVAWAVSMVWWMFVAFCLGSARLNGTGVGAYFIFAGLAAAAWWQRKDEVATGA